MNNRKAITNIIMMGDSLSDRGTMNKTKLFGLIPIVFFSGVKNSMNNESFTNGYPWSSQFIAILANQLTIRRLKDNKHIDDCDIADGVINSDPHIQSAVRDRYDLTHDKYVNYQGKKILRSYTEGGLLAHEYGFSPSISLKCFFARLVLTDLKAKRDMLLKDDKKANITVEERSGALVIEWSGANDLVTANVRPEKKACDMAIKDRIKNMRKLIEKGYRNFVIFNMPDLSLTPRYQNKNIAEQDNARSNSQYFNEQLQAECNMLQLQHPECQIDVFDVYTRFTDVYEHPAKYHFDKDKRKLAYITSSDFKIKNDKTAPATGYMYWDDVHPTADMHAILASQLFDAYESRYNFTGLIEEKRPNVRRAIERTDSEPDLKRRGM